VPLKANAKIFQGAFVALSGGLGVAASTAVGLVAAGVAHLDPATTVADNTGGADSAQTIRVAQGVFRSTTRRPPTRSPPPTAAVCYIVDDNTVAKTYGANGTRSGGGRDRRRRQLRRLRLRLHAGEPGQGRSRARPSSSPRTARSRSGRCPPASP
jgi:hypothetical protein